MSTTKKAQEENKDKIASYTKEIEAIKKYRKRIYAIEEGKKTLKVGKGIHTQPKWNAYKINKAGKYGNLIIDVPKLMGHLRLIAKKNGKTVIDKGVDSVGMQLLTTSNFIGASYHAALLFSGLRSIVLLSFCCRSVVFSANQRRRS